MKCEWNKFHQWNGNKNKKTTEKPPKLCPLKNNMNINFGEKKVIRKERWGITSQFSHTKKYKSPQRRKHTIQSSISNARLIFLWISSIFTNFEKFVIGVFW